MRVREAATCIGVCACAGSKHKQHKKGELKLNTKGVCVFICNSCNISVVAICTLWWHVSGQQVNLGAASVETFDAVLYICLGLWGFRSVGTLRKS